MGSATAKVVPCGSTCVRGNAVTSLVLMGYKDLPPAAAVMEDKEYNRDTICRMLAQQGITPCITPRRCRKKPVHDHKKPDRRHHKFETLFSRLKDGRRLVTRYDGCTHVFCIVAERRMGGQHFVTHSVHFTCCNGLPSYGKTVKAE